MESNLKQIHLCLRVIPAREDGPGADSEELGEPAILVLGQAAPLPVQAETAQLLAVSLKHLELAHLMVSIAGLELHAKVDAVPRLEEDAVRAVCGEDNKILLQAVLDVCEVEL